MIEPKLPRTLLVFNALGALLLLWLYGGDVLEALAARSSPVSALVIAPNLPFAAVALVLTLGALGLGVTGAFKRRPAQWRGYRAMALVAVTVLFVDLFIVSSSRPPWTSSERTAWAIDTFATRASRFSSVDHIETRAEVLNALLPPLETAPFLLEGAPAPGWKLSIRRGCAGPAATVENETAGTLVLCVSTGGKRAWVSAVGLPTGARFGSPAIFGSPGHPAFAEVTEREPPEAEPNESGE